jgi:hypothetical protein
VQDARDITQEMRRGMQGLTQLGPVVR